MKPTVTALFFAEVFKARKLIPPPGGPAEHYMKAIHVGPWKKYWEKYYRKWREQGKPKITLQWDKYNQPNAMKYNLGVTTKKVPVPKFTDIRFINR